MTRRLRLSVTGLHHDLESNPRSTGEAGLDEEPAAHPEVTCDIEDGAWVLSIRFARAATAASCRVDLADRLVRVTSTDAGPDGSARSWSHAAGLPPDADPAGAAATVDGRTVRVSVPLAG